MTGIYIPGIFQVYTVYRRMSGAGNVLVGDSVFPPVGFLRVIGEQDSDLAEEGLAWAGGQ